jgi:hypothetical protein
MDTLVSCIGLRGVSPIRLIHKLKAGIRKAPPLGGVFRLVLFGLSLHRTYELEVPVFVRSPRRDDAPEVELPTANFAQDHLDLPSLKNRDDAPIPNGLADALSVLAPLKSRILLRSLRIPGRCWHVR